MPAIAVGKAFQEGLAMYEPSEQVVDFPAYAQSGRGSGFIVIYDDCDHCGYAEAFRVRKSTQVQFSL